MITERVCVCDSAIPESVRVCGRERADTENNATDIYIQIIFFFFS